MINSVAAESRERRHNERRELHRLQDGIHTAPFELVEQAGGWPTMEIYFDAIGVFVDPVDDHCVAVVRSLWQPGA